MTQNKVMQSNGFKTEALAIDRDHLMSALYLNDKAQFIEEDVIAASDFDNTPKKTELKYVQFVDEAEKIAVLKIHGALDYKASGFISWLFGLTSIQRLTSEFNALVNNERVETIILDVDSPGGNVVGIPELAERIYQARTKKRIIACANPMAASAAFWIASAATKFVSMESGYVGSVGVFRMHIDYSEKFKNDGIKVSFIKRGDKKTQGNPYEPLSNEAKKDFQFAIDEIYGNFINTLARNRAVEPDYVENNFGKGILVNSKQALQNGMIDGILTLENLIDQEAGLVYKREKNQAFLANAKNRLILEELK